MSISVGKAVLILGFKNNLMMKKSSNSMLKSSLLIFALPVLLITTFSCKDEEALNVAAGTTTFDKSTIEKKTYSIGDVVEADIPITPKRPLKNLKVRYSTNVSGSSVIVDEIQLNGSSQPFTYHFVLPLEQQKFQSVKSIFVTIEGFIPEPDPNGWAGGPIIFFTITLK